MDGKTRRAGPGRLSAEETAGLTNRLLDAAAELFVSLGYSGTTMEAIARTAGASTKTVYSRYANKADMLQAVLQRLLDQAIEEHAAALSVDPAGTTPRTFLLELARRFATVVGSPQGAGINRLAFAEAFRFPELARFYVEGLARGVAVIENALVLWRNEGLLASLPKPAAAATLFVGMVTDRPRIRSVLGRPMSTEEIETHVVTVVDVFLRGCGYSQDRK